MYRSRLYIFLLLLLFSSLSWVHAECYLPDKSIARHYQACKPEDVNGSGSACCELSTSVCTTEGYCFGSAAVLYRGGCTDPKWASPNCAKKCLNIRQTSFANILPCGNGVFTKAFCCSGDDGSESCCDKRFSFEGGTPYAPYLHDEVSTSTITTSLPASGSSSTSTSLSIQMPSSILASTNNALSGASAPSSSISTLSNTQIYSSILASTTMDLSGASVPSVAHSATKSIIAIGLGIGLPFALWVLLSVGFILYRERQRRRMMESLTLQKQPSTAGRHELS